MSIQIFILSNLMEGNAYPYQLKKKLADFQSLDLNHSISESKLYYNFESLKKQGLIALEQVLHEDNRPDKQMFTITEKGRAAFPEKIYYVFEHAKNIGDMVVGLANLKYVDPNKVLLILEKQLANHMAHWEAIISFDREKYMIGEMEGLRGLLGDFTEDLHQHTTTYLNRIIQYVKEYKK